MLTSWGWGPSIYSFIKLTKHTLILTERTFKWFMNPLFESKRFWSRSLLMFFSLLHIKKIKYGTYMCWEMGLVNIANAYLYLHINYCKFFPPDLTFKLSNKHCTLYMSNESIFHLYYENFLNASNVFILAVISRRWQASRKRMWFPPYNTWTWLTTTRDSTSSPYLTNRSTPRTRPWRNAKYE